MKRLKERFFVALRMTRGIRVKREILRCTQNDKGKDEGLEERFFPVIRMIGEG